MLHEMTALNGWANFYVIVGSSAGALIGLQFVVMTLVANMPDVLGDAQACRRLYDANRRFISKSCCCCQHLSMLRGMTSPPPRCSGA